MKIRPKIPKFAGGNNLWYSKLVDYDPLKYESVYNPDYLFAGDTSNGLQNAWISDISGFDRGRYLPTSGYGAFGKDKAHFNYTKGVEGQDYYKLFGEDLLKDGKFTPIGEAWAKAVDALLPKDSNASFYDKNGNLRTSWTTQYRDVHGRPALTFNDLASYVNHVRNDLVLGARHNIFGKTGRRYFYKDENGVEHWVNPKDINNYIVSDSPIREILDGTTMWEDYELKGLKSPSETPQKPNPLPQQTGGSTEVGSGPEGDKKETPPQQGNDLLGRLRGMIPGLLSTGRLAGNLINSAKVYDEALKGIKPTLILPYYTHRQVVGDEATKQAYYRRAAAGLTKAAQPFTSDADRQMAYMLEARRVGDELRAQGDLADNQEIRRTSDESNQHQWANTQRATEVANTNLASLNDANEKKHTLLALKHSALWSSIDNYLKEIATRKRLLMEEDRAYANQINQLDALNEYENDEAYLKAYENLKKLGKLNEVTGVREYDTSDQNVIAALKALKTADLNRTKRMWLKIANFRRNYNTLFIKSGSKITYKKDDKLLYKSTKDVVDHFRKMCRRYPDRERKILKLAPHPGSSRKYQVGGQFLAPFTIYTPDVGVSETARTVSLDSAGASSKAASSSKDTSSKDVLDLIKMFKDLKGVKVDVSSIYSTLSGVLQEAEIFGKELNSLLIASMYLRAMLQLNNVSRSKEIYDEAYKVAAANGALNEIAVDSVGNYAVLNKETGKIETVSKIDTSKHIPLTNSQLLTLREYRPDLAFDKGDYIMLNVVANGVGLLKIAEQVKSMAGKLGSSELKLDGMSEVEANLIKQGIKLLQGAPDGHYKTTTETKNLLALKLAAINYIMQMLPENYKAVLDIHGGAKNLIPTFLSSQIEDSLTISFSPLTGKAASKDDKDSSEKIKSTPLMLMIQGEGGVPRTWNLITKDSNIKMSVDGIEYSQLPKITEDMSLDKMLSESGIAGILDSKLGITFGDQNISPELFKDIMYSNSGGMIVTLPCKIVNGHKEVNLGVKKTYEEAIQEVESKGLSKNSPEYYKILGEVLKQKGLNGLLDSNGYPDRNKFGQFLVVEAYTTDKIKNLDTSSQYIEKVKNPDALLEERMIKALSTDSKKSNYNLDIDYWLYGDNVYRGTVFIPLNNNLNAAINASGNLISVENARELENKFQNFNKASNMKSSNSDVL